MVMKERQIPTEETVRQWKTCIAENINRTRSKIVIRPWHDHPVNIDQVFTDLKWIRNVNKTSGRCEIRLHHCLQIFEEVLFLKYLNFSVKIK